MATFRSVLADSACISPASVYDPLSARAAHRLGFDIMMLAGSVASAVALGAPDLVVLTLTELAEQARRITRVSPLPLLVDADHGFGNALSVMRCVQELEGAGVAALTIEDTLLPRPFGADGDRLISVEEATGKFRAALAARRDPETAILARTSALRVEGLDACIERLSAYTATGVDGIFLVGIRTRAELEAMHRATDLPLVLGTASRDLLDRAYLASQGVRVVLLGHAPFQAAVRAMYETLAAIHQGATTADLRDSVAPAEMLDDLTAVHEYDGFISRFLTPE
ncbi:MAG: oxaloacetate decarboxylase [Dehalococcoidia bacterium]